MTRLSLCGFTALMLSACSMEAMSERVIPVDVRPEIEAQTNAFLAGETDFIFQAFPEDRDDPEFRMQIQRMVENVPHGEVIERNVVGVQGRTTQSYSETEGAIRTGTFNLAQEIEFEDGFLLIQTAHTLDENGQCCQLRAINASRHESSPMYASQQRRATMFKILGALTLLTTIGTALFLIIRVGGRKAREKQMGA